MSSEGYWSKFRQHMISTAASFSARIVILACGGWWVYTPKVNTDYSKYLGPDWKPTPDATPGTVIANHSTFMDIMTMMYL